MRAPFIALPALALGLFAAAPAAQAQNLAVQVDVGYAQPSYGYGYRPHPTYRRYQPPIVREQVDEYSYERHTTREYAPR